MIVIDSLTKVFRTKKKQITAVDNINLSIAEGEIFGVIGYSGAGKSTFIRLLNRLEEPSGGSISIGEKEITKLSSKELRIARQDIGMVFQHFNLLWSRTVRENIAFPLEVAGVKAEERKRRVEELIGLVGLAGREDAYPSELSGGQKQRVGIARALANNPKVLLCDEATSALDPETTNSILDLLVRINKELGLTIVLITHEMQVIQKICNRVAVMEAGRVVELGDVLDVFSHPKQPITKKFIEQALGFEDEEDGLSSIVDSYKTGKVLRLHFVGEMANDALISRIAKDFNVEISIIQGKISQTQRGAYGTLVIHMNGEQSEEERALSYIKETKAAKVEVLRNAE
ncbi:ATP-binding cassette domain-containing protein [Aciduricibacillus chroicocephali]|uniref:ATP-binding cassette domain-containing protein n=1 Tax=Aciduricibacillus chroicocephali TaxID=3054939 RepID=A0ABY9KTM4_9BACI|nr:ATP-binding cassette domain-containing protein [Bacillaceae bacterium 44XB]